MGNVIVDGVERVDVIIIDRLPNLIFLIVQKYIIIMYHN